jgi:hypothetical protein
MPLHIRRLPGGVGNIIDPKSLPPNNVLFNPSCSEHMLYLRATRLTPMLDDNYIILYDLHSKKQHVIQSPADKLEPTVNLFQGVEDLRICFFQGRLWFSGTTTHASNKMRNELIVGTFSEDYTRVERMSVVDIGSLPVKNVCPFVWQDRLHLLDTYLCAIYEITEELAEDGTWQRFAAIKVRTLHAGPGMPSDAYRGSTSPVHLHGNIWGCVVHDIIFNDNTKLVTRLSYIHHWMEFDIETGAITFFSTPFWVALWGIEYVSGIQYTQDTGHVCLYLGVQDNTPIKFMTTLHDLRVGK